MVTSLAGRAVTAVMAVAAGIVAPQAPAHASRFTMVYTCAVPLLGDRTVRAEGTLTATPDRLAAGRMTWVVLHVSHLNLRPPVAIGSWSAAAQVDVSGAQTTAFRLSGAGGPVPAYQPVTGDLVGGWIPRAAGFDQFRVGRITLKVSTSAFGDVIVPCAPREPRPMAETISVVGYAH
jgi:hypothetical protein